MMYEIYLLLIALAAIGMAKRRRGRRWNPNNKVVRVEDSLSIGALTAVTVAAGDLVAAADEEYRAISAKLTWSTEAHTGGEGPMDVGLAMGDYTTTELKEWIESKTSINRGDLIANEQASRRARFVGTFAGVAAIEVLNDGKPITTKLNWHIPAGETVNVWCYNRDTNTLTTGTLVKTSGTYFIRYGQ